MTSTDSFGAKGTLRAGGAEYEIFRPSAVAGAERPPVVPKVLLGNRHRPGGGARTAA